MPDVTRDQQALRPAENRNENWVLGLDVAGLAELTIVELQASEPALRMLLHRLGEIKGENTLVKEQNDLLRNDINSLRTYQVFYMISRERKKYTAALVLASSVLIGFGTNLLTQEISIEGALVLVLGVALSGIAAYLVVREKLPDEF